MWVSTVQMMEFREQALRAVRAADAAYRTPTSTATALLGDITAVRESANYAEAELDAELDANGDQHT